MSIGLGIHLQQYRYHQCLPCILQLTHNFTQPHLSLAAEHMNMNHAGWCCQYKTNLTWQVLLLEGLHYPVLVENEKNPVSADLIFILQWHAPAVAF